MKKFSSILLAALCVFSFAACDKKEDNKSTESSSVEGEMEPFFDLMENQRNMTVYTDIDFTIGKEGNAKQINLYVEGKIDGENAYACTKVKLNDFSFIDYDLEGYYVDGTLYNAVLEEKKSNIDWNDWWWTDKVILMTGEKAPLHLLSTTIKKKDYSVEQTKKGSKIDCSVSAEGIKYVFITLASFVEDMSRVNEIFLNSVEFCLYLTKAGVLEYIESSFSAKAHTTEGIVNLTMAGTVILKDIGKTSVSAPDDAIRYEDKTEAIA